MLSMTSSLTMAQTVRLRGQADSLPHNAACFEVNLGGHKALPLPHLRRAVRNDTEVVPYKTVFYSVFVTLPMWRKMPGCTPFNSPKAMVISCSGRISNSGSTRLLTRGRVSEGRVGSG